MKHHFSKYGKERGFELVEVVLAASILSLTLLSVVAIAGRSVIVSRRALQTYVASSLLEEGAEATRIVRDGGWTNISGLSAGSQYYPFYNLGTDTWSLSSNPSDGVIGVFTRSIVMSDVDRNGGDDISTSGGSNDPGTKFFTETVSWRGSDGRTLQKTLSFYLMDII